MTDQSETKKAREVEKHFTSPGYEDRADKNYSAWPSFGGKLPEGEVLHKFEIRMPIPATLEEMEALYGYSPEQALARLVKAIWTDADNEVKAKLFEGIELPIDAQTVAPHIHEAAQEAMDQWRYKARRAGRKSTKVDDVVAMLVSKGVLTEDQAASISTTDDLERAVAEAMA